MGAECQPEANAGFLGAAGSNGAQISSIFDSSCFPYLALSHPDISSRDDSEIEPSVKERRGIGNIHTSIDKKASIVATSDPIRSPRQSLRTQKTPPRSPSSPHSPNQRKKNASHPTFEDWKKLKSQLAEATCQIESFKKLLYSAQSLPQKLRDKIYKLEKDNTTYKEEIQEYKEKLRRGGHNIARKLEEDLSKAKERHHPTSADYKAKYKSLTRKLEATRKMYLDSTDLDNTQAKLDHVRREVRLREKRSQKLKLRIQQLESELVNYKDKSQELKEENRALNTRISELEEEVSAATISLDEKESYIKNLQHRCEEDYDGDEAGRRSSEISTSGTECFNRLSMQSETFRHSLQSDDTAIIPESSDEVDASSKPKSQLKVGIDTQISKSRIAFTNPSKKLHNAATSKVKLVETKAIDLECWTKLIPPFRCLIASHYIPRSPSTDLDPNHLTCYLCGRKYGTKSLAIHLPQCKELWIRRQSRKPLKERKALPGTYDMFGYCWGKPMKIVHYVAVQIVEELFSKGHLRDISEGANQVIKV
eukprot:jgi/Bigna1/130801/aug1.12_g5509